MNLDLFDRRRAERFAQLLDETSGGPRHHARAQADGQLDELVTIGRTLSAVRPAVQVDPEFRTGLRAMLVATAERDGIGVAPTETAPGSHAAVREPSPKGVFAGGAGRRIRARGAIVLGVAAGALAVSGISAASENAVPGDALYGVKRSTERAQLAMAGSDVTRGQLSLDFARTRLAEAAALDGDDPAFPTVLDDMDNDTRKGVRLLTTSAVAHRDVTPFTPIETFVNGQRQVITPMLDRLAAENRKRALLSMSLLDQIVRRADGLRSALACDSEATSGADSLGPRPRACWVGSDATSPDTPQQGQGEEAAEPGRATTGSRTPDRSTPSSDATAPDATEPGKRSDGDPADEAPADDGPAAEGPADDRPAPNAPADEDRPFERPDTDGAEPAATAPPPATQAPPSPAAEPARANDDKPGLIGRVTDILGGD